MSSGQWNVSIFLPSTVWKVKIVQTSPNNLFFERMLWTPGSKCKRHSFLARNRAVHTLTSILNVGCPVRPSPVLEASEWLQALEQLLTYGMGKETGLGTEGCFQEHAANWQGPSDLGVPLWGPDLQKSNYNSFSLRPQNADYFFSLEPCRLYWCAGRSVARQRGNCGGPNCC